MIFFAREMDLEKPINSARNPKLEDGPFDQDLGDVTKLPALPIRNAFKFTTQVLTHAQADLSLPLTHAQRLGESGREKEKETNLVNLPTSTRMPLTNAFCLANRQSFSRRLVGIRFHYLSTCRIMGSLSATNAEYVTARATE